MRCAVLLAMVLVGCGLSGPQASVADAAVVDASVAGDASVAADASVEGGGDAGTPGDGGCPSGASWCDDFEAPSFHARWAVKMPNCSGTGRLSLEAGAGVDGGRAVRVEGGGGYCDHVFIAADGALPDIAWVRARVRFSAALGANHVTFFTSKDLDDQGKDLRMGGQAGIFMWNRESDDATLPALSPQGIALSAAPAAGQWLCLEFALGHAGTLATFVDGQQVSGLNVDGVATAEVDQQWLSRGAWQPRLTGLAFGWESYAGQAMTLWFDDVALGTSRLGCR